MARLWGQPRKLLGVDRSIATALSRYGFAVGVGMLFGGGGGVIRQSINFQTSRTSNAVMIAATTCRVRVSRTGYSERVSIRSASAKSRSVRPPLL